MLSAVKALYLFQGLVEGGEISCCLCSLIWLGVSGTAVSKEDVATFCFAREVLCKDDSGSPRHRRVLVHTLSCACAAASCWAALLQPEWAFVPNLDVGTSWACSLQRSHPVR